MLLSSYTDVPVRDYWHWISDSWVWSNEFKSPVKIRSSDNDKNFLVEDLSGRSHMVPANHLDVGIPELGYVNSNGSGIYLQYNGTKSFKKGLCLDRITEIGQEVELYMDDNNKVKHRMHSYRRNYRGASRNSNNIAMGVFSPSYVGFNEAINILDASVGSRDDNQRDFMCIPISRNFAVYAHYFLRQNTEFSYWLCYKGLIISSGKNPTDLFNLNGKTIFLKERLNKEVQQNEAA